MSNKVKKIIIVFKTIMEVLGWWCIAEGTPFPYYSLDGGPDIGLTEISWKGTEDLIGLCLEYGEITRAAGVNKNMVWAAANNSYGSSYLSYSKQKPDYTMSVEKDNGYAKMQVNNDGTGTIIIKLAQGEKISNIGNYAFGKISDVKGISAMTGCIVSGNILTLTIDLKQIPEDGNIGTLNLVVNNYEAIGNFKQGTSTITYEQLYCQTCKQYHEYYRYYFNGAGPYNSYGAMGALGKMYYFSSEPTYCDNQVWKGLYNYDADGNVTGSKTEDCGGALTWVGPFGGGSTQTVACFEGGVTILPKTRSINLRVIPPIKINLSKYIFGTDEGLDGAVFSVTTSKGVIVDGNPLTIGSGVVWIQPKTTGSITITLTETTPPEGYIKLEKPITINCSLSGTWSISSCGGGSDKYNPVKYEGKNVKIYNIPKIEFDLDKLIYGAGGLGGMNFTITTDNGNFEGTGGSMSISIGSQHIVVEPTELRTTTITLTEKEDEDYIKLPVITITISWGGTKWVVGGVNCEKAWAIKNVSSGDNIAFEIYNIPKIKIKINKLDTGDRDLNFKNITFSIAVSGGKAKSGSIVANGSDEAIIIPDGPETVTVTLTESGVPYGHIQVSQPIVLTFNLSGGKWTCTESSKTLSGGEKVTISGENTIQLTIQNRTQIEKIKLGKFDSLTGEPIVGATFNINITNAKNGSVSATTGADGQLLIEDIEIIDVLAPVTVTITEISVPQDNGRNLYKLLDEPIVITFDVSTTGFTNPSVTIPSKYAKEKCTVSVTNGYDIEITATDIPVIYIGGNVWEDGQEGMKVPTVPDGIRDSGESGVHSVLVSIWCGGTQITADVRGNSFGPNGKIVTDNYYEFKDIEYTNEIKTNGIEVRFEYDGIFYKSTIIGGDSKADENKSDRTAFNSRFTTITQGKSNDGTAISYDVSGNVAKAHTTNNGVALDAFNMKASTEELGKGKYTAHKNVLNIDFGLVYKETDFALYTDLYDARVEVNGKKTTYTYNKDSQLLTIGDESYTQAKPTYNLYLYESDYYYRISDYAIPQTFVNGTNNSSNMQNSSNNGATTSLNATSEITIYSKYRVVLNNQSTKTGSIDQVIDYYDSRYEFVEAFDSDGITKLTNETPANNSVVINTGEVKQTALGEGGQHVIYVVLKTKLTGILSTDLTKYENAVEIMTYSTQEGGLLDKDSAPGDFNAINKTPWEDDTDIAGGLQLQFYANARQLSGYVFDDMSKDGIDNDSQRVNDVIVQLIEIKDITLSSGTYQLEYIWQEIQSGKATGKAVDIEGGTSISSYNITSQGTGYYEFNGFVAGNYIVRFIYGDGSTYDITDNVKTYNGIDYQSTIDKYYTEGYYNAGLYSNTDSSVARDNEARRLEVIANTLDDTIDKTTVEKILESTWMCAESSKISVSVDTDSTSHSPNDNTTVKGGETEYAGREYPNIKFGLTTRPRVDLTLEKHVSSLQILTATGTTLIDATANYDKDFTVLISGVRQYLSTMIATRTQRGYWQFETEINELIQGATLNASYYYRVTDNSDEIYVSKTLEDEYEKSSTGEYVTYLKTASTNVKNNTKSYLHYIGTYLGNYYYTGIKGANDVPAKSLASIQDYLHKDLTLKSGDFTLYPDSTNADKSYGGYDAAGAYKPDYIAVAHTINTNTNKFVGYQEIAEYISNFSTTLSSTGDLEFPGYIAQIYTMTNVLGIKDMTSKVGNLQYIHSDDPTKTLASMNNEDDEFWAETIRVTKPTGEDKTSITTITEKNQNWIIVTLMSATVLVIGIVLIKKFAIKK